MHNLFKKYFEENTDRFAARWMCKRSPLLWEWVVAKTAFLPSEAKPLQRCWHITNSRYEIPVCPVSCRMVSWFENRYLTYADQASAAKSRDRYEKSVKTYQERSGYTGYWSKNPEVRHKVRQATARSRKEGNHKPTIRSETWREKVRATWEAKTDSEANQSYKYYLARVKSETNKSFRKHRCWFERDGLVRSRAYHIDHIFSVYEGWRCGIDPTILAHWTNLRMICGKSNSSKNARCDKDIVDLMFDYNTYLDAGPPNAP